MVRQHGLPDKVTIDQSGADTAALEALREETDQEFEIRQSKDLNNLIRGPKVGQSYAFRLNPYYAWRGDSKKGREWIQEIIQGGKAGK